MNEFEQPSQSVHLLDKNITVNAKSHKANELNYLADVDIMKQKRDDYFAFDKMPVSNSNIFGEAIKAKDYRTISQRMEDARLDESKLETVARGISGSVLSMGGELARFGEGIWDSFHEGSAYNAEFNKARGAYNRGELTDVEFEDLKKQIDIDYKNASEYSRNALLEKKKQFNFFLEDTGIAATEDDGFLYKISSGVGSLAMGIGAGMLAGPGAAAALFGTVQSRSTYEEAIENGVSPKQALVVGVVAGAVEGALEFVGIDRVLRVIRGRGLMVSGIANIMAKNSSKYKAAAQGILATGAIEGLQEGAQQTGEEVIMQSFGGRAKDVVQALRNIAESVFIGFLLGGAVGGGAAIGSATGRVDKYKERVIERDIRRVGREIRETDEISGRKVLDAVIGYGSADLQKLGFPAEVADRMAAEAVVVGIGDRTRFGLDEILKEAASPSNFTNSDINVASKEFKQIYEKTKKPLDKKAANEIYNIRERVFELARQEGLTEEAADLTAEVYNRMSTMWYEFDGTLTPQERFEKEKLVIKNELDKVRASRIEAQKAIDTVFAETPELAISEVQGVQSFIDGIGWVLNEDLKDLGIDAKVGTSIDKSTVEALASKDLGLEDAPSEMFQRAKGEPLGKTVFEEEETILQIFRKGNASTIVHELGHIFLRNVENLSQVSRNAEFNEMKKSLDNWLGEPASRGGYYNEAQSEKFADGFVNFVKKGNAPTPRLKRLFRAFRDWLSTIKEGINEDIKLNEETDALFTTLLAGSTDKIRIPKVSDYKAKVSEVRGLVEDIRADRTPKLLKADMNIRDVADLVNVINRPRPADPRSHLKSVLRKTGVNYNNMTRIDAERFKNAGIPNKETGMDDKMSEFLKQEGFMEFTDPQTYSERVRLEEQAAVLVDKALTGEKVFSLAQDVQDRLLLQQDYDNAVEFATEALGLNEEGAPSLQEIDKVLNALKVMKREGFKVIEASDINEMREALVDIEGAVEEQEETIAELKEGSRREMKSLQKIKDKVISTLEKMELVGKEDLIKEIKTAKKKKDLQNKMWEVYFDLENAYAEMMTPVTPVQSVNADDIKRVRDLSAIKKQAKEKVKALGPKRYAYDNARKYLSVLSERLNVISPKLKEYLRTLDFEERQSLKDIGEKLKGYLEKSRKFTAEDFRTMDLLLLNSDRVQAMELAKKYGAEKDLENVFGVLESIYEQARRNGLKVGFLQNYFPRGITNVDDYMSVLRNSREWSNITRSLEARVDFQRMTEQERAWMINTEMRGYHSADVTAKKPGFVGERRISYITPELLPFYKDHVTSLIEYVEQSQRSIKTAKMFGKGFENLSDGIAQYVADLQKGEVLIDNAQAREVLAIIQAYVDPRGMSGFFKGVSDVSYAFSLGQITTALGQIQGFFNTLYSAGVYDSVSAVFGKKRISLEELGIDGVLTEYAMSKGAFTRAAADKIITASGLKLLDKFDKLVFVEANLRKYERMAKQDEAGLRKKLGELFEQEDVNEIIEGLKSGEQTYAVKRFMFSIISDFHPVSSLEVPEGYLRGGNGRIFYTLKTYAIKQMNTVLRESINKIATEGQRKEGFQNLLRLVFFYVIMGGGVDAAKDMLLGKELDDVSDYVIDNMLKLALTSKYAVLSPRENLTGKIAGHFMPPLPMVEEMYKDFYVPYRMAQEQGRETKLKPIREWRTWKTVPMAGNAYYYWFGGGAKTREKYKDKKKK